MPAGIYLSPFLAQGNCSDVQLTASLKMLDGREVAKHNHKESCWIVIDSKVYDVTSFLRQHPGGAAILLRQGGAVRGPRT